MSKQLQLDSNLRLFDTEARNAFDSQPEELKIKSQKAKTFILFPFEAEYKIRQPFEVKEEESLFLIQEHLKIHKKCYVASSHGKDSIVLVHLIYRACQNLGIPMIEVWLNNTLNIYKEEPAYWDLFNKWLEIEDKFRIFLPPKDEKGNRYTVWSIAKKVGHLPHFRAATDTKKKWDIRKTPECCDILKKASIKAFLKSLPKEDRFDCHFVGTRAEESRIRRLGVLQRCRSYIMKTRSAYPIRTVTPMSFWSTNTWKAHQGHYEKKNNKKVFVPNPREIKPENDIDRYFEKHGIPKNPVYLAHDLKRMGCASCPAFKNWELKLAQDPTEEGLGMLKQNLRIMKTTEKERYDAVIKNLRKHKLVPKIIAQLENEILLTDFC